MSRAEFDRRYERFAAQCALAQPRHDQPRLRMGERLDAEPGETLDALAGRLADKALEFHGYHHGVTEGGGRVSAGLIRVARINNCIALTHALALLADAWKRRGVKLALVPYHGRLLLAVRDFIESQLDVMLKRNVDAPNKALFATPYIKRLTRVYDDVLVLVVATPVAEVGRDHDYDYALIEPSSSRSIIQCAGRVNRHRREAVNQPNVAVLGRNLKELEVGAEARSNEAVFTRPGFESVELGERFESHAISEIAPALARRPHPGACLADPHDESAGLDNLPKWERANIAGFLEKNLTAAFVDCDYAKRTNNIYQQFQFRSGPKQVACYYDPDEGQMRQLSGAGIELKPVRENVLAPIRRHLLIGDALEMAKYSAQQSMGLDTASEDYRRRYLSVSVDPGIIPKAYFDPDLGVFTDTRLPRGTPTHRQEP